MLPPRGFACALAMATARQVPEVGPPGVCPQWTHTLQGKALVGEVFPERRPAACVRCIHGTITFDFEFHQDVTLRKQSEVWMNGCTWFTVKLQVTGMSTEG